MSTVDFFGCLAVGTALVLMAFLIADTPTQAVSGSIPSQTYATSDPDVRVVVIAKHYYLVNKRGGLTEMPPILEEK